jgi:hypothetical protein
MAAILGPWFLQLAVLYDIYKRPTLSQDASEIIITVCVFFYVVLAIQGYWRHGMFPYRSDAWWHRVKRKEKTDPELSNTLIQLAELRQKNRELLGRFLLPPNPAKEYRRLLLKAGRWWRFW